MTEYSFLTDLSNVNNLKLSEKCHGRDALHKWNNQVSTSERSLETLLIFMYSETPDRAIK